MPIDTRPALLSAIAVMMCATLQAVPATAAGQACLTDLESQIRRQHPNVRSMVAEQFESELTEPGAVLVLDVREPDEFEVSHLPGAVRVEPEISAGQFIRRHGAALAGRKVLLYCSVGVRSSVLAARVDAAVRAAGGQGAYNLQGGVFAWHNTGRKLQTADGETPTVHPYSRGWSRYIDFDNLTSYGRRWWWR